MTRDNYQQDKKSATGWVAGVIAVLLTGCVGMLIAHDSAIAVIKEKQAANEKIQDEIRADVKELLKRTPKL